MTSPRKTWLWPTVLPVIALFGVLLAQEPTTSWQPLSVPGFWQDPRGKLAKYDGFAWYRCWVKVPADWKGSDLLTLFVEAVRNVHEVYFNGVRVGGVGSFPPGFRDATETANSYTIADKDVRPGAYNFLAVRVYGQAGKGGFKGTAPATSFTKRGPFPWPAPGSFVPAMIWPGPNRATIGHKTSPPSPSSGHSPLPRPALAAAKAWTPISTRPGASRSKG